MHYISLTLTLLVGLAPALRYDPELVDYNLNQNELATDPLDYSGEWEGHTFNPSPENWRFPFYTLFLDRFVNGDPTNDNANGTAFEQDPLSNQLRHGGDIQGLIDGLDYLQGMGIKGLYVAGSPFINQPFGADSYSPLDLTLLDFHYGKIVEWRNAIEEVHRRGMYIILDHTMATMGDLIGFEGFLNESTPFKKDEHKVLWKSERQYHDFRFSETHEYNETCNFPNFWLEDGFPTFPDIGPGCYNSDFDQFGDTEAFGVYDDWRRSITKFASVQDRLREWEPSVLARLKRFSCMTISMLDPDGFRFDKALQTTIEPFAEFAQAMRECAKEHGKDNFFMPGEVTGGNVIGSIYYGRGRQPDQKPETLTDAFALTNESNDKYFTRELGKNAIDSGAFSYSIYRSMTRFLGMDGNLEAGYDLPIDWVDAWNDIVISNDLINADTGKFDPRHMYGSGNQDVFRWPAIKQGIERNLLAIYVTSIHLPGMPILWGGEEQSLFSLDSTAANYIFGRQALTSSPAWHIHGCYKLGSAQYFGWPVDKALGGCDDETVGYDHRDPSHPVRNIIKRMFHLRENYRVLDDGWLLQRLSNQTKEVYLPGSRPNTTEGYESAGQVSTFGVWSVARAFQFMFQDDLARTDPMMWLVYHNSENKTTYDFDCTSEKNALVAPFSTGSTVKNVFYPYDEITLVSSTQKLGFNFSAEFSGCHPSLTMEPFEYRAYVQLQDWIAPPPMITQFLPGHDGRLLSSSAVNIEFEFSAEMDCTSVSDSISISGVAEGTQTATVDEGTAKCILIPESERYQPPYSGAIGSVWRWSATLTNVKDGVLDITVTDPSSVAGTSTGATDHFFLRIGKEDNPLVFPNTANYSTTLLSRSDDGSLSISHKAAGASKWRYSLTWASSWSPWLDYTGGVETLDTQEWSGTKRQEWEGDHIIAQYWSQPLGTSSILQQGDSHTYKPDTDPEERIPRRFPHLFAHGPFNNFGFDAGLDNVMRLGEDGWWKLHHMAEWPSIFQVNVWGINPDGQPDATFVLGDADSNGVLNRISPASTTPNFVNITEGPPSPFLAYRMVFNDGNLRYRLEGTGNRWLQLVLYILLATLPIVGGTTAVLIFMKSFYDVKVVEMGVKQRVHGGRGRAMLKSAWGFARVPSSDHSYGHHTEKRGISMEMRRVSGQSHANSSVTAFEPGATEGGLVGASKRRNVLIATIEYNIDDWNIKIKIGGLGVMAQLMGKALEHQDLIWVVPCVGGIEYPVDTPGEPMYPVIMGKEHEVKVQYHQSRNIKYVLLDAPIFRSRTKSDPYPARMDDMDSGIYYSAWNQAVAETIRRFNPDLYHINDYHAAAAPLYLLPATIPCCLSLHNAEFQGMWPMRTPKESKEVCEVYNLTEKIMKEYFQFGSVANLLHAGVSYLRIHQNGFGAVGVSTKYGERSYARYPIFWGLKDIGSLPNPDPSDTAVWDPSETVKDVAIDQVAEKSRAQLRKEAQEWAGLNVDTNADLFVFVGRWSLQKGVDLIADIFPSILEKRPSTQLICIGPVIDLYGKFAALKLSKLMEMYPGRVFSKPEFTQLPPCIFSGAEFALIPSRDEPFGLVAVEFGRKGALGVGAKVGGLGQMPGFWYTVESTSSKHLLRQFRGAITEALDSKEETRQKMRAWSGKQRFPVAQWLEQLEVLQSSAIRKHGKHSKKKYRLSSSSYLSFRSLSPNPGAGTPRAPSPSSGSLALPPPGLPMGRQSLPGTPRASSDYNNPSRQFLSPEDVPLTPPAPSHPALVTRDRVSSDNYFKPQQQQQPVPSIGPVQSPYYYTTDDEQSRASSPTRTPPVASTGPSNNKSFQQQQLHLLPQDPFASTTSLPRGRALYSQPRASVSTLSVHSVVGDRDDFSLQSVDPFFNDSTGEFYREFEAMMNGTSKESSNPASGLTAKNSDGELCIEEFLVASEKEWFTRFRNAKLGRSASPAGSDRTVTASASGRPKSAVLRKTRRAPSIISMDDDDRHEDWPLDLEERRRPGASNRWPSTASGTPGTGTPPETDAYQSLLPAHYKPPTGIKKFMLLRVGDWPLYSFFLALGQIISANSYQIVLLTGEVGQPATKLYTIASTYLVMSLIWWIMSRTIPTIHALSLPFIFYSVAFILLGLSPLLPSFSEARNTIQTVASCVYAAAASSGSLHFALNFGDEGGVPTSTFIFRAFVIESLRQAYIIALWYWGSILSYTLTTGEPAPTITSSLATSLGVCLPIAALLLSVAVVLYMGLPTYYRETPPSIPSFYKALFLRRRLVPWFLLAVVVQNFFLSTLYGRNWFFLFSSQHVSSIAILFLALGFYVILWGAVLFVFARYSNSHPWLVPLFAIGLGAPRWAQMWWGTSGTGLYLPWAGGFVAQALVSRVLWLWLGLLDAVQGMGIGMMLLLTLTRLHVAGALVAAQVLGSAITMLARGVGNNRVGPGDVFPDLSLGVADVVSRVWFWGGLVGQLVICFGFFKFFRKEQVAKP